MKGNRFVTSESVAKREKEWDAKARAKAVAGLKTDVLPVLRDAMRNVHLHSREIDFGRIVLKFTVCGHVSDAVTFTSAQTTDTKGCMTGGVGCHFPAPPSGV